MPKLPNLFQTTPPNSGQEIFQQLLTTPNITIERIQSNQASSPPNFWYDQKSDEWVILLKGTATLHIHHGPTHQLTTGDYLLIPKHQKHRIQTTSHDALWLAIHLH